MRDDQTLDTARIGSYRLLCGRDSSKKPDMSTRPAQPVDPRLLELLVCPLTKQTLEYNAERQELVSRAAKLAYPIRDGIPIMLPEEARRLDT
jgi:uncharacterized protein YbaR (Trm112 family)